MIRLLCEMNRIRKELMEQGIAGISSENTAHKYAKGEEKALLNRMGKYRHNHHLFLHDFSVPFDDNISERDLRKAKNRQKMAEGFRKESGHRMYCNIMTIIKTLKKRKMGMIENIKKYLWAHRLYFSRCYTCWFSR